MSFSHSVSACPYWSQGDCCRVCCCCFVVVVAAIAVDVHVVVVVVVSVAQAYPPEWA